MDLTFVDAGWIQAKMREHGLRHLDMVEAFDGNKGNISSSINGKRGLTVMGRAAFYYYFKALEESKAKKIL